MCESGLLTLSTEVCYEDSPEDRFIDYRFIVLFVRVPVGGDACRQDKELIVQCDSVPLRSLVSERLTIFLAKNTVRLGLVH